MRRQEQDAAESKMVLVFGQAGSASTEAMHVALRKAGIPFAARDFDKDGRYKEALKKSGFVGGKLDSPVVRYGSKAWWNDPAASDDNDVCGIPWPAAVAMELRHLLGTFDTTQAPKPRIDADIDTEIYERFSSMQEAFLKIDLDRDGFITTEELQNKCREWNILTSEGQRAIDEADWNHDGALDFNEFAKRFDSVFITGNRGVLKSLAPHPHRKLSQPKSGGWPGQGAPVRPPPAGCSAQNARTQ